MQQTFRCPECGAEFPTQRTLEEHVSREHMGTSTEAKESQEKCPACSFSASLSTGMEFPTAESLAEHEKTHRSEVAQA